MRHSTFGRPRFVCTCVCVCAFFVSLGIHDSITLPPSPPPPPILSPQVVYASRAQADIAFNGISTSAHEDASGRLEKKIFISGDGQKYIKVGFPFFLIFLFG